MTLRIYLIVLGVTFRHAKDETVTGRFLRKEVLLKHFQLYSLQMQHETIIRTGITCTKIFCYMRNSACRWRTVENAKIFRSYVKNFRIFPGERNCRILIGLCK